MSSVCPLLTTIDRYTIRLQCKHSNGHKHNRATESTNLLLWMADGVVAECYRLIQVRDLVVNYVLVVVIGISADLPLSLFSPCLLKYTGWRLDLEVGTTTTME